MTRFQSKEFFLPAPSILIVLIVLLLLCGIQYNQEFGINGHQRQERKKNETDNRCITSFLTACFCFSMSSWDGISPLKSHSVQPEELRPIHHINRSTETGRGVKTG